MTAASISAVVDFADACEVTALSLLDGPPDLTAERWAGLALVLAFANCDAADQDLRRALLAHAVRRAGTAFAEALPTALSAVPPQWTANVVTALAETELGHQVRPGGARLGRLPLTARPRPGATRCRHWPPTTGPRCPSWPTWPASPTAAFPPDDGATPGSAGHRPWT